MKLNEKIKTRRKQLKLTLDEVAEYVGVGLASINRWERGITSTIPLDKVVRLAQILKLKPEVLVFDDYDLEGNLLFNENLNVNDMQEIDKEIYDIIPTLSFKQKVELCNVLYRMAEENEKEANK